ncbi:MAG: DUF2937 family protein [Candidatus Woesearchaeota archaeon]|nr:DUF2937 family protein [Candidatus Woesearchaeota archaeon]MDP7198179.1 DUF2937 family protein [Candidatus Woesearchaeota archaeon]MDP7467014.1 DUF2937 family protein [Candidatus Woesearchaeota archaeon]MDP7646684.1 DUF2937 family protein [Candidatus Woesearchaeota archaeon]
MNYTKNKTDQVASVGAGLGGALTLGQFPQYLAQYTQRLGGHIDEATRWSKYEEIAQRAADLTQGLEAITDASTLGKLPRFLQHADWEIAQRAWDNFTPGMAMDGPGLLYAAVGAGAALGLYEVGKIGAKTVVKGAKRLLKRQPKLEPATA